MKQFFNFFTVVMLIGFLGGLIAVLFESNWVTAIWILAGLLWMLIARWYELRETIKDMMVQDYEAQLLEARHLHAQLEEKYQKVSDKYQAKLKENYDLACQNKSLTEDSLKLVRENQELSGNGLTFGTVTAAEKPGSTKV